MAASSSGLFASVRSLLGHSLELVKVRLEILLVELQEEKARLLRLLLLGAAAFLLLGAGLVFVAFFLTVLLWEDHRLLVLGMLSAFFLTTGGVALVLALQSARSRAGMFSATLQELAQDHAAVQASIRRERGDQA